MEPPGVRVSTTLRANMSRARLETEYAYNGLSTTEFGERTGQSAEQVRELIAAGWFDDKEKDGKPLLLDIAGPAAKQPRYKILPAAVDVFFKERGKRRIYPPRKKANDAA